MWDDREVKGLTTVRKNIKRPEVGRLELWYQTFDVRESTGLKLTVATAEPGRPGADALALLCSLEVTQRLGALDR